MLMPGEAEFIKHDLLSFYAVSGQKKERKRENERKIKVPLLLKSRENEGG